MHKSYSLLILQSEWFISSYRATWNNCFSSQWNNNNRAVIKTLRYANYIFANFSCHFSPTLLSALFSFFFSSFFLSSSSSYGTCRDLPPPAKKRRCSLLQNQEAWSCIRPCSYYALILIRSIRPKVYTMYNQSSIEFDSGKNFQWWTKQSFNQSMNRQETVSNSAENNIEFDRARFFDSIIDTIN